MPNASVAAAASGLPELSRRAVLAGSAAAFVAPLAPAAAASAMSPIAELIADYEMALEAEAAAEDLLDRLHETADLPVIEVAYGNRRFCDRETGKVTWGQWLFRYAFEVERHFAIAIDVRRTCPHQARAIPGLEAERDRVLSELRRQEAVRAAAEQACGITAADEMALRALEHLVAIRTDIVAHRPATMAEVAEKNAFLRRLHHEGFDLRDYLPAIFGEAGSESHI
jgi:hypothetical protein